MSFYRCRGCDNRCTADVVWNLADIKKRHKERLLYCPMTGKRDAEFVEVDPTSEDPCFGCSDHCPAHNCARKRDFEERVETGIWYDAAHKEDGT